MKALRIAVLISIVAFSTTALAHHAPRHGNHGHYGGYYHWHNGSWSWVPAAIITGAIVYEINRQQQPQQTQPPVVIVEREPVESRCTEWREVQDSNGRVYRERTCTK